MKTFRILILGAGFSKPAGFPLAAELFHEVRKRVRQIHGADNPLERDLRYYLSFLHNTEGFRGSIDDIDIEQLLSFLDIEHYLELRGSDMLTEEGNETQLLVRHAIGYILLDRTPEKVPELYKYFASKLSPADRILTFNYDTLLEQALDSISKPYRLFPSRYSDVNDHVGIGTVDLSREEVVILKMHGSIDWFDKSIYDKKVRQAKKYNRVSNLTDVGIPESLVNGPRFTNDPLAQVYRVKNPSFIYTDSHRYWECPPLLLNPSHSKLLYIKPLIEFWRGWGREGGLNLGLGVVGYSLPGYDDYARQTIYKIARNYQQYEPSFELNGRVKQPVRILDYRPTLDAKADLRKRYRFMERQRTKYRYGGLSEKGIDWLMA